MSDWAELKRLAEDAVTFAGMHGEVSYAQEQFIAAANPKAILALIAENKQLRMEASTAKAQREHAEMCGDDFVRMNDRLSAEVEALRQMLALLRGMIGCTPENDKLQMGTWISTKHPVIQRIDAAMSKKP